MFTRTRIPRCRELKPSQVFMVKAYGIFASGQIYLNDQGMWDFYPGQATQIGRRTYFNLTIEHSL